MFTVGNSWGETSVTPVTREGENAKEQCVDLGPLFKTNLTSKVGSETQVLYVGFQLEWINF